MAGGLGGLEKKKKKTENFRLTNTVLTKTTLRSLFCKGLNSYMRNFLVKLSHGTLDSLTIYYNEQHVLSCSNEHLDFKVRVLSPIHINARCCKCSATYIFIHIYYIIILYTSCVVCTHVALFLETYW